MAETVTIEIPADAPEKDVRRVRQRADLARRNATIRRRYPSLRDKHGRKEAIKRLADRFCCSTSTVKHVIYRG